MDFPFDKLDSDISPELPSGPDLEAEGDAEFMRFSAQIDGVLPASFASFDRAAAELPSHIATIAGLILRSKDLRLITAAAKLFILDRNFADFVKAIDAAEKWLKTRWETVLPELLDGDPVMRSISLQSLDDVPHTVKPLESAPLFKSKRLGQVTLRSVLLADGKLAPRQATEGEDDGEKVPSPSDITSAIRETPLGELVSQRNLAIKLVEALNSIESLWDEKTGQPGVLRFAELKPKALELRTFLDYAVATQDPSQAIEASPAAAGAAAHQGAEPGQATAALAGDVTTLSAARDAMAAAAQYFQRHEPSSPVRLILAQAEALVGKGFYESLEILLPDIASLATVSLGRDLPLKLPFERLSQLLQGYPPPVSDENDGEEATLESEDVSRETEDTAATEGEEEAGAEAPAIEEVPLLVPQARHSFRAANRQQALALIETAGSYFRAAEPSSPIPMLFDIARTTVGRDFLSLVRDVMPAHTLRVDE